MAYSRTLLLCGSLALAGCGGGLANSWVNPGNWFGKSSNQAIPTEGTVNPLILQKNVFARKELEYQGFAVDQIKSLRIERRPGGAIVRVVGVANAIGSYNVRLEPDAENGPNKGVLSFTLNAEQPKTVIQGGSDNARQITAAKILSDQDLAGVRSIVVKGARNQLSTRRR
ncbi:hypothetical protein [Planktotalea sp.]|uniref:hypothetical protein n=1 Tax=Planktotalea sp. TaxID=2029877 RepID=UPI0025EE9766|nr:hypothetical protein [Planktotalea sp.]